jgi:predicted small secreted protein
MKIYKKALIVILIIGASNVLFSCGNARWATGAGLDVDWGPNGPRVRPHMDFDIYNGGRIFN